MGGTVDTLACCLGCCVVVCAPLTLARAAMFISAVLGWSTAAVGGCTTVAVAAAHGCAPAALEVVCDGAACPAVASAANGYGRVA
eukprot:5949648-Amphidinium_carterae.1